MAFFDADAPWDNPTSYNQHHMDMARNLAYTTGKLKYTNSSITKILPSDKYSVDDAKYKRMKANITVILHQQKNNR